MRTTKWTGHTSTLVAPDSRYYLEPKSENIYLGLCEEQRRRPAMRGSRNSSGRGGWEEKKAMTTLFFMFLSFVLNLFYSFTVGFQWFILRKTILFQGFMGEGGPFFSRGVQMLIL